MPTTWELFNQSEVDVAVCVEFAWGSQVARYCDQKEAVVLGGMTFQPLPEMYAEFGKEINGTAQAEEVEVFVPRSISPIALASLPYKHAPVNVRVWEANLTNSALILMFKGGVGPIAPERGKPGMMRVTAYSGLIRLRSIIGIQATSRCRNPFGDSHDSPCGKPLAPLTHRIKITAIGIVGNPLAATVEFVDGADVPIAPPSTQLLYWTNGKIFLDGAYIKIRSRLSFLGNTITFQLKSILNPTSLNAFGFAIAGCDRTLTNCKFWENEQRFNGLGLPMPDYNPNYSSQ